MRNLTISASGLNSLSCLENYRLSRIERLSPLEDRSDREARDRGTLVHYLLEQYYNLPPEADKLSEIDHIIHKGSIKCLGLAITDEVRDKVFRAFKEYVLHYLQKGSDFVPVAAEKPISRVLLEDPELDIRVILEGRIDLAATVDSYGIIVDHKSEEKKNYYTRRDNQFLLYAWATGISTVVVNVIGLQKTLKPEEKFRRIPFTYFKHDIEEWEEATTVKVLRLIKAIDQNYFERNIEQCKWCSYQKICDANPNARKHITETQFKVAARYDLFGG